MLAEWPAYQGLNRRTVAEIQKRIIDQGKRHPVSRVLHTKTDRDMIAVWRQDLNRILQIFNVRSIGPAWPSLIVSLLDGVVDQQQYDALGSPS